jgi:hypothetical protein
MQMYEIHLYVPKKRRLTPNMLEWLMANGQDKNQPEAYWPVRRVRPRALARHMLKLDPELQAVPGPGEDVELHYPDPEMGILLYVHDRGVVIFFPYQAYTIYARVVLGICYTYIRYLYDAAGFWSYDPQLNIISFADDFQSLEDTALLMEEMQPRLLSSG